MAGSEQEVPRFSLIDIGGYRLYIDDGDFHWDAALRVGGDFESDDEKFRYMRAFCDVLNKHATEIPAMPAHSPSEGER